MSCPLSGPRRQSNAPRIDSGAIADHPDACEHPDLCRGGAFGLADPATR
jgi:hypothetical protein